MCLCVNASLFSGIELWAPEETRLMTWRKGCSEVIQSPLEFNSSYLCCVQGGTSPTAIWHIAHKEVNGKRFSAMRQWTRDRKKSLRVQPAQQSHARRDAAANRKPRSAALFRAAVQQPQRARDRCICQCQTRLWRFPVSCNVHYHPNEIAAHWRRCSFTIMRGMCSSSLSCPVKACFCCPGRKKRGVGQSLDQQSEVVTFSLQCLKSITKLLHRELCSWHIWKCFSATRGVGKGVGGMRTPQRRKL